MAVDYSTLKKGGFMRQKQKNCFSLRLAVVGGNLTAENLKTIAEVADKYGDGHVHLTSRQSVEIPFIKLDDIEMCIRDSSYYYCLSISYRHGRRQEQICYRRKKGWSDERK